MISGDISLSTVPVGPFEAIVPALVSMGLLEKPLKVDSPTLPLVTFILKREAGNITETSATLHIHRMQILRSRININIEPL
jgi:hypothetical protein